MLSCSTVENMAMSTTRTKMDTSESASEPAVTEKVDSLAGVKHIILVLSGKGGVGKSTVAVQVSLELVRLGYKVGLLDVDLCGPSIPTMLNIEDKTVHQCSEGWVPVYVDNEQRLGVMSIGFLLASRNDAVIWRGPKKNAMIKQFLRDVYWGKDIDYLIVDTPPGTSDEHMSVVETLQQSYRPDGAILVTTPQAVAVGDVRRELTFCLKTNTRVIGVIENMSGFVCPHCTECSNIFSKGGGEKLAQHFNVPFLGCIPLCTQPSRSDQDNNSTGNTSSGMSSPPTAGCPATTGLTTSQFTDTLLSARPIVTDIVQKIIAQCSNLSNN